ncbi:acetoacetate-CoA ligase [Lindgomyces ingoldianus]|uniref:Acetoacetate-CoA ligase n=1 Tax=Lindgomyces ingoldianus TaxID=673940 RepID=A0ACB6QP55_9PLEO|nr:acetoacetate-CoA ligase [Lindgomyces ingoldianus]KAF2468814.1 acetoacetate-CoA ligase [Lindgomyces ingoldianus]
MNGNITNCANGTHKASKLLWRHPAPQSTPMWKFLQHVNEKYGLRLQSYETLHKWSIEHIGEFWDTTWEYLGIRSKSRAAKVVDNDGPMFPRPTFFEGAYLNFAENLLYPVQEVDPESPAIIAATETTRETVTWKELRERVRHCQAGMLALGLDEGDRVAGYVANHTNALVAMLATTSLGGIWTAVSPDTGVHAVLERLRQIEPVLLFSDNAAFYNGRSHPVIPKVREIASALSSLRAVVVFHTVSNVEDDLGLIKFPSGKAYGYSAFTSLAMPVSTLTFKQLPPDHPVYILYSSGTTGAPKCIVHGAIGTLLQHKKEHILHCSITPTSRLFYFTTCTWMMWHWLVSGLASGATLVLYDGSPFRYLCPSDPSTSVPDDIAMPRLINEVGITHFGTSAKYLSVLEQKSLNLKAELSMKTLEAIYSTGSPLAPSTFSFVYNAFPPSINLGSITGGTDIISLFGAPNPLLPVYEGEIQGPGLGMDIRAFDYTGQDITKTGEPGDLVCTKHFICQPVSFWGKDGEKKYRSSYFDKFENIRGEPVWHHGDFVRFNRETGGLWMLGRSDGILKPAGVRFGSAEIYNVLLQHFADEVADALCIGQRREEDTDETVCLFLKITEGRTFSQELVERIRMTVKKELSARHVPGAVDECPEIPVTTNGKKVEGAVKQILCGLNVKTSASVANAECLDWYREWAKTH